MSVFKTSFGKFVPCDKATYKKLKRINHLYTQFAWNEAYRWDKSQRRNPEKRTFRRYSAAVKRKIKVPFTEAVLFEPFYKLRVSSPTERYPKRYVYNTLLWDDFTDDMDSVRALKDTAEEVVPLKLSAEQIDDLLVKIEAWKAAMVF